MNWHPQVEDELKRYNKINNREMKTLHSAVDCNRSWESMRVKLVFPGQICFCFSVSPMFTHSSDGVCPIPCFSQSHTNWQLHGNGFLRWKLWRSLLGSSWQTELTAAVLLQPDYSLVPCGQGDPDSIHCNNAPFHTNQEEVGKLEILHTDEQGFSEQREKLLWAVNSTHFKLLCIVCALANNKNRA